MGIIIPLFLVIICCLIIWRASDSLAIASDYIGRNLSDGVRGATINAIGSSLPELFTSLFFLFYLKDVDGFSGSIGTTAGSAIFNGMIIPAAVILIVVFTAVATKINVSQKVIRRDGLALIIAEFIFIILISGNKIDWWHGLILMIIYFIYLTYMLKSMQRTGQLEKEIKKTELKNIKYDNISLAKAFLIFDLRKIILGRRKIDSRNAWQLLIFSTIAIASICLLLVQACEWIGSDVYTIPFVEKKYSGLDIPIMFVAVILASAASSVPDTIISMNDARKGNYDDAISNALGSNIFDICFAMGFPLFLYTIVNGPIHMHQEVIDMSSELRMLLLVLTIGAFSVYIFKKRIGLTQAFLLLGLYTIFSLYVIGRGVGVPLASNIAEGLRAMVGFLSFLN